jgi:hypothetical protein
MLRLLWDSMSACQTLISCMEILTSKQSILSSEKAQMKHLKIVSFCQRCQLKIIALILLSQLSFLLILFLQMKKLSDVVKKTPNSLEVITPCPLLEWDREDHLQQEVANLEDMIMSHLKEASLHDRVHLGIQQMRS